MMYKFFKSCVFAVKGLRLVIKTQLNFRIHLLAALLVLVFGLGFSISAGEWLIIVLCIGLVLIAEVFNTAIEEIVNFVSPEKNQQAGIIKDIAAAAVLIAAVVAIVAGLIIFAPKLM